MEPGASDAGTASLAAFVAAPEWPLFRQTLIGLTDVTRSHFSKLVEVCQPGPLLYFGQPSCADWPDGSSSGMTPANLERHAAEVSCPEEGTQGLKCLTMYTGCLCSASWSRYRRVVPCSTSVDSCMQAWAGGQMFRDSQEWACVWGKCGEPEEPPASIVFVSLLYQSLVCGVRLSPTTLFGGPALGDCGFSYMRTVTRQEHPDAIKHALIPALLQEPLLPAMLQESHASSLKFHTLT